MSKINPLQRIAGIPDDQTGGKQKPTRTGSPQKPFGLDRVEISPQARLVQRAEHLHQSAAGGLAEDAHRVSDHWYLIGYNLPEADGLR